MKIKLKKFDLGIEKKHMKYVYFFGGIVIIGGLLLLGASLFSIGEQKHLVKSDELEFTQLATAYVIKNETIIERDKNKSLIPVVAEGHRVSNKSIIATYKSAEYDFYLAELERMDNEILGLMKDLPPVYSGEIESMENQIRSELKKAVGETSYVEMQDYINTINGLVNKRAVIVGQLAPEGSAIKELIDKRNEYETTMKSSNDNIIATDSGIVSYKTDGLEAVLKADKITSLDYNFVRENISKKHISSDIKIIDNFCCYIMTKVDIADREYITPNKTYKIRIVGDTTYELKAKLVSYNINNEENTVDLTFQIQNQIENIATLREVEIEIIWWSAKGMYVPNEAIFEQDGIKYVSVIKYGKYVEIPIKVYKQNDRNSVVENYESSELEELNIQREYILKLYDNVVVKN
ncbi:MAG: hypothetical protein IKV94_03245 [Clostridia bacterium]|nr:hypothetical protein [Clostridia bacterium]